MGGNGNELSGAIREWEWFFKCVNFGNGNGKDPVGMGGVKNTANHSRTSLIEMQDLFRTFSLPIFIVHFMTYFITQIRACRLL